MICPPQTGLQFVRRGLKDTLDTLDVSHEQNERRKKTIALLCAPVALPHGTAGEGV